MKSMNEDDLYRSSTQFRLWSFTERALADLRSSTNSLAAQRVRDAIKRSRTKEGQPGSGDDVDCLTVEEEQKLVRFYCSKAMDFSDFCGFPTSVKAKPPPYIRRRFVDLFPQSTALQILKRFYLSNSPMTYHPKSLMPCALFLATKCENHYTVLSDFASKLPKTSPEDVLAPEFLLTQGLRFTFDVRHPYRALEGGTMELNEMALSSYIPPAGSLMTGAEVKARLLSLKPASGDGAAGKKTPAELQDRIKRAHGKARELLNTTAILTDAYFLYTPSQIFLSSLLAADEPVARFYLHVLLSSARPSGSSVDEPSSLEIRLLSLLKECAALLTDPSSRKPDSEAQKKELTRIDKKLWKCRNPEKVDFLGMSKGAGKGGSSGQSKEGAAGEGEVDEKVVKKRKLERDRAAKEEAELFGGELKR
ncbi:MAG: hypothetical protein LQ340_000975 [Diploschistes diacapsis]|nr:MAG: hypothetical protein LQ340_000975 [Diploschistes diacapsis]